MIARKAGAALAAGCTLLVKPASDTPLSALALAQTGEEAGLPPGVFNVLPADHKHTTEMSKYLCESTDVDVISFTGSTAVGKLLLAQSASTVKRVCLELGGSAPFLVFDSADLDVAIKGAMGAKFRGSGQTCVAANRFFVQQKIHDDFVTKMTVAMKGLVVGDGMNPKTTIGPMINENAVKKWIIREKTNDFQPNAADKCHERDGHCTYGNIWSRGCYSKFHLMKAFADSVQLIHRRVWLIASSSRDPLKIYRCHAVRLQSEMVELMKIRLGLMSCAEAAFGGVKESGLGREGAAQGIDEFTQWKYICTQH
ncbi:hypothetical protein OSTOST_16209 [Ostertagia ostertagi]